MLRSLGASGAVLRHHDARVLQCSRTESKYSQASQVDALRNMRTPSTHCLGRRLKKTKLWPSVDAVNVLGAPRNLCSRSTPSPTMKVAAWMTPTSHAQDFVRIGPMCWKLGVENEQDHSCGTPFSYVQGRPDHTPWTLCEVVFDELLATKEDSAPGPDGLPYSDYRRVGGSGAQILFNTYKQLLDGGGLPPLFAPTSNTVNDQGRIVRSPDARRSLTLCNL